MARRSLVLLLTVLACACSTGARPSELQTSTAQQALEGGVAVPCQDVDYAVFITGQSNALEQGDSDEAQPETLAQRTGVLYARHNATHYTAGLWRIMNGLRPSTFGVERTLAQDLMTLPIPYRSNILKFAWSGSSLKTQWLGGPKFLFTEALWYLDNTLATFPRPIKPAVVVWMHGNADATSLTNAQAYNAGLHTMFDGYRAVYGNQLYVVITILNANVTSAYKDIVRQAQFDYAASDPRSVLVDLDDLPFQENEVHYTSAGVEEIGYRIFNAVENKWTWAQVYADTAAGPN
jgi:carbohydrate esterase-like sialic acid-specific acetylesterase